MKLSNIDLCFYKVLLQTGYQEDVYSWIDDIAYKSPTLEGIYLELVSNQGDINSIISILHNYIDYNKVDDKELVLRLRLFIKEKLDKNEISFEKAVKSWGDFAYVNDKFYIASENKIHIQNTDIKKLNKKL